MKSKEVRKWVQSHPREVERLDTFRKELEAEDLDVLLSRVELSGVLLDKIKALLIEEIICTSDLPDETKKG